MPIPWMVVLKSVPWTEVIRNAPKVADSAKRLWSNVSARPGSAAVAAAPAVAGTADAGRASAGTDARVAALEAAVTELQQQLVASSDVIQALAEQNAQLIARVDAHRVRVRWLSAGTLVALLAAAAGLAV